MSRTFYIKDTREEVLEFWFGILKISSENLKEDFKKEIIDCNWCVLSEYQKEKILESIYNQA